MVAKLIILGNDISWVPLIEELSCEISVPYLSTFGPEIGGHMFNGTNFVLSTTELNSGIIPSKIELLEDPEFGLKELRENIDILMGLFDRQETDSQYPHKSWANRWIVSRYLMRMWASIIKSENPDLVFFAEIPHTISDYVCYMVCKMLDTPYISARKDGHFQGFYLQNELFSKTCNIVKIKNDLNPLDADVIESRLSRFSSEKYDVPEYMQTQFAQADYGSTASFFLLLLEKIARRGAERSEGNISNGKFLNAYEPIKDLTYVFSHRTARKKSYLRSNTLLSWERRIQDWISRRKNYIHKRKLQREYEKLSVPLSKVPGLKSIYLALHFQPEATTLPTGLQFHDQELMLEYILSCLPQGWQILVKEHPSQLMGPVKSPCTRDLDFYRRFSEKKNVILLNWDTPSDEVVRKSCVTATVSGTVGIEGLLKKKPVIIFGDIWWAGVSGAHCVKKMADLEELFEKNVHLLEKEIDVAKVKEELRGRLSNFIPYGAAKNGFSLGHVEAIKFGLQSISAHGSVDGVDARSPEHRIMPFR